MAVGSADLWKAISSAWTDGGLDTLFRASWSTSGKTNSDYVSLVDGDNEPQPPLPYCVAELSPSSVKTRMSWNGPRVGDVFPKLEIRDAMLTLSVHSGSIGELSSKASAAYLAEEVMKVFGGHPTVSPRTLELDNGSVVLCQFQSDGLDRQPQNRYRGILIYRILADVTAMT